jgi:integrase/recombinase XerD
VENGVPIETIADLAGHSSLETTRIYTTKTEKELRDILDDM